MTAAGPALLFVHGGAFVDGHRWSEFENPLIDLYCAELVYRLG